MKEKKLTNTGLANEKLPKKAKGLMAQAKELTPRHPLIRKMMRKMPMILAK